MIAVTNNEIKIEISNPNEIDSILQRISIDKNRMMAIISEAETSTFGKIADVYYLLPWESKVVQIIDNNQNTIFDESNF